MTSISMLYIIKLLSIYTILSCIIIGCSSFQQLPLFISSWRRSQLSHSLISIRESVIHTAIKSSDDIVSTYSSYHQQNEANTQLWIDLRGTSLTPNIALELWSLEDDNNNNAPFTKCLVSSIEKNAKDDDISNNLLDILLVEEGDTTDDMPIIFQQKEHIGRILSLQTSSTSMPILPNDPLSAIDIVSKGQWLLIDTNEWKKVEEDERISMVIPLIDLISSGFMNDTSSGGGIGVTCHTNNEVVKIAMYIQSMMNASGGSDNTKTKTLDSGIVVPDTDNESSSSGSMQQQFAIIVPFDMELLRTAKLLFADENR